MLTRRQALVQANARVERQKGLLGSLLTSDEDILKFILEALASGGGEKHVIPLLCTSKATYSQTGAGLWLSRRYNGLQSSIDEVQFNFCSRFVKKHAEDKLTWENLERVVRTFFSQNPGATLEHLPDDTRETYEACTRNLELFREYEAYVKKGKEVEAKLSELAPMAKRSWWASDHTKTMKTRPRCIPPLLGIPSTHGVVADANHSDLVYRKPQLFV